MHQSVRFSREVLYQGNLEKGMDGRKTVMIDSVRHGNSLSIYGKKSIRLGVKEANWPLAVFGSLAQFIGP